MVRPRDALVRPKPDHSPFTVHHSRLSVSPSYCCLGVGDGGSDRTRALKRWKFGESVDRERRIAGSYWAIMFRVSAMRSSSSGCVANQLATAPPDVEFRSSMRIW